MLNFRRQFSGELLILGNLTRSSHNPYSGSEMPGNMRKFPKTHVVDEEENQRKKTAEEKKTEDEILNDLVNLKLKPDRTRKIAKMIDEQRNQVRKAKAIKRQLKFS